MGNKFKGTSETWFYKKPTEKFDACTVSESGKLIGYCAKNSSEDRANEKLRAAALVLLNALIAITDNIDRWLDTGEAADAETSKKLHDDAKKAISKALL